MQVVDGTKAKYCADAKYVEGMFFFEDKRPGTFLAVITPATETEIWKLKHASRNPEYRNPESRKPEPRNLIPELSLTLDPNPEPQHSTPEIEPRKPRHHPEAKAWEPEN